MKTQVWPHVADSYWRLKKTSSLKIRANLNLSCKPSMKTCCQVKLFPSAKPYDSCTAGASGDQISTWFSIASKIDSSFLLMLRISDLLKPVCFSCRPKWRRWCRVRSSGFTLPSHWQTATDKPNCWSALCTSCGCETYIPATIDGHPQTYDEWDGDCDWDWDISTVFKKTVCVKKMQFPEPSEIILWTKPDPSLKELTILIRVWKSLVMRF